MRNDYTWPYVSNISLILGKDSLFLQQVMEFHKYIRHSALQLLGPECLKGRFMHEVNIATHEHLKTDFSQDVLEVKDTAARV